MSTGEDVRRMIWIEKITLWFLTRAKYNQAKALSTLIFRTIQVSGILVAGRGLFPAVWNYQRMINQM
jgi:hypothetical protein